MSLQSVLSTEEGTFVNSFMPLLKTLQFLTHSEEMSKSLKCNRAHAASGFLFGMVSLASVFYCVLVPSHTSQLPAMSQSRNVLQKLCVYLFSPQSSHLYGLRIYCRCLGKSHLLGGAVPISPHTQPLVLELRFVNSHLLLCIIFYHCKKVNLNSFSIFSPLNKYQGRYSHICVY